MRRIADCRLWQGHAGDARNVYALLDREIEAVVDLADSEPPLVLPRQIVYCRYPLVDGAGNPPWLIRVAVQTVATLIRSEVSAFVFCSAGMSRSPVIIAAAIASLRGGSLVDGLRIATDGGRGDVSTSLLQDVAKTMGLDSECSNLSTF